MIAPAVTEKVCSGCGFPLPLEDFYPQPTGKHGRRSKCRKCLNTKRRGKAEEERNDSIDMKKACELSPVEALIGALNGSGLAVWSLAKFIDGLSEVDCTNRPELIGVRDLFPDIINKAREVEKLVHLACERAAIKEKDHG